MRGESGHVWQHASGRALSRVAGGGAQMVFRVSSDSLLEITEIQGEGFGNPPANYMTF